MIRDYFSGLSKKTFHAGTLTYTLAGLYGLFFWLLWGDFCFALMNGIWKTILPLQIKALEMPNWVIGVIVISIPSTLNVILNPIISTASDRTRSRWGRRRPFMLFATPFISLFLCLMGFSSDIGHWLYSGALGQLSGWSLGAITVGVIGLSVFLFYTADLFVSTVFYYFFNDVVPVAVMARFLALFRMVGTGAGALYSYFIFPHALEHMKAIFFGAAAIYFAGFVMMCLVVKEGNYPDPKPLAKSTRNPFALALAYVKECTHQKIFILLYIHMVIWTLANVGSGIYGMFVNLSLGLSMQNIGTIAAFVGVATVILTYPAGVFADRFHPMRLMIWIKLAITIITPFGFIWLFTEFSTSVNFWVVLGISSVNLALMVIYQATTLPLLMRLFPRESYGQYCSFNAICQAAVGAAGGFLVGYFLDTMRVHFPDAIYGKDYFYRLIVAWDLFFSALSLLFLTLLYKEWLRLGRPGEKSDGEVFAETSARTSGIMRNSAMNCSAPQNPPVL